jgi:hypothetical protein
VREPAFQLWPKFTGAIDDPVGPGPSLSFGSVTGDAQPRFLLSVLIVRRRPSIVTPFDSGKQAGYCGASARIKFDDDQFEALYNEHKGDKQKLWICLATKVVNLKMVVCYNSQLEQSVDSLG